MPARPLYDLVALLARAGVGLVFMAHGWQKVDKGIGATADDFERMDVPAATAAAIYATFAELLGGLALVLGALLPVIAILLFLDMAGAFVLVHADDGLFLVDDGKIQGGYELVLVLAVACLLFAAGGGGRLTVDRAVAGMWSARRTRAYPPPEGFGGPGHVTAEYERPTVPQAAARPHRRAPQKPRWATLKRRLPSRRRRTEPPPRDPDDVLVAGNDDKRA